MGKLVIQIREQPDEAGSTFNQDTLIRLQVELQAVLDSKVRAERAVEPSGRPAPGFANGRIWMSPDFDEPLEDFAEYMR
jgi:Protein of unknown function (DUF2281)